MPAYGGQALIEGVLMRSRYVAVAAMRAPEGKIVLHVEPLSNIYRSRFWQLPFIRGVTALWDALGLGMRFLTISANLQAPEEKPIEGKSAVFTIGVSLLLAIGLFFLIPAGIAQFLQNSRTMNAFTSNLIEGGIRLAFVIGYIWAIGKIPEIQRVFAYHGAEHKTINAFEGQEELTPEKVQQYPLEHPRCGTSFLLTLIIVSIVVFTLLGDLTPFWRIATRVLFLPILAGIAYEFIRWSANHIDNPLVRNLIQPNLVLQRLTTREPDPGMLEVAIAAFKEMLRLEKEYASSQDT
jgi:uncharacterized protein YqhQ